MNAMVQERVHVCIVVYITHCFIVLYAWYITKLYYIVHINFQN